MTMMDVITVSEGVIFAYFIGINAGYLTLNFFSIFSITRYMRNRALDDITDSYSTFHPPISLLVPAYNEEATIVASIKSLLQLNYSEFEIVVINDGSKDSTLATLIEEFKLIKFPEAYRKQIKTNIVKAVYHSSIHPTLRVIDKANGGKADSLNAGINLSKYPLFCAVDADSILQRDSLKTIVKPFLEDPRTVACGGTVRIANGCEVRGGFLEKAGLPSNLLALFQIVEYLRAFLFGRMGWSALNGMLIISGAFGVFSKSVVLEAGGYRTDTMGEDMELVVRMHRKLRLEGRSYRIIFVPDPVCWTEAPENLTTLKNQRTRWQQGLSESLTMNRELFLHPKGGTISWLAFPFFVVFEFLGPLIEVLGYLLMISAFAFGLVSYKAMAAFMLVAIGLGILLSVSALLLEEMSFHIYTKSKYVFILFLASVAENFGYRQINSLWRMIGFFRWLKGGKGTWGEMKRKANWTRS